MSDITILELVTQQAEKLVFNSLSIIGKLTEVRLQSQIANNKIKNLKLRLQHLESSDESLRPLFLEKHIEKVKQEIFILEYQSSTLDKLLNDLITMLTGDLGKHMDDLRVKINAMSAGIPLDALAPSYWAVVNKIKYDLDKVCSEVIDMQLVCKKHTFFY